MKEASSKEDMKPWVDWIQKCGKGMVDLGAPLANGQMVTKAGVSPSKKNIVGYSILQAETMEKVQAMLKDHPHLKRGAGCEIEVHEALPVPGT